MQNNKNKPESQADGRTATASEEGGADVDRGNEDNSAGGSAGSLTASGSLSCGNFNMSAMVHSVSNIPAKKLEFTEKEHMDVFFDFESSTDDEELLLPDGTYVKRKRTNTKFVCFRALGDSVVRAVQGVASFYRNCILVFMTESDFKLLVEGKFTEGTDYLLAQHLQTLEEIHQVLFEADQKVKAEQSRISKIVESLKAFDVEQFFGAVNALRFDHNGKAKNFQTTRQQHIVMFQSLSTSIIIPNGEIVFVLSAAELYCLEKISPAERPLFIKALLMRIVSTAIIVYQQSDSFLGEVKTALDNLKAKIDRLLI